MLGFFRFRVGLVQEMNYKNLSYEFWPLDYQFVIGGTFYRNFYFCGPRQEGRKLTMEVTFIRLNQTSYGEDLRPIACVKPRFVLDLV